MTEASDSSGEIASPWPGAPRAIPSHRKTVTVLLPTLNEEEAIGHVLDELLHEVPWPDGRRPDILVVDGRSEDRTPILARERGATVVQQRGRGKAGAITTGLETSRGNYIVVLDGDHSYPARHIPDFLAKLDDGADVVIGSRFLGRIEEGAMSSLNYLGNRWLSFLASVLYGHRVTDVCSGMWALGPRARSVLHLNSVGFEVEAEMFARCVKGGLRITEVPIEYRRRKGRPKLRGVLHGVKIAAKLIRKRFT